MYTHVCNIKTALTAACTATAYNRCCNVKNAWKQTAVIYVLADIAPVEAVCGNIYVISSEY